MDISNNRVDASHMNIFRKYHGTCEYMHHESVDYSHDRGYSLMNSEVIIYNEGDIAVTIMHGVNIEIHNYDLCIIYSDMEVRTIPSVVQTHLALQEF